MQLNKLKAEKEERPKDKWRSSAGARDFNDKLREDEGSKCLPILPLILLVNHENHFMECKRA